MTVPRSTPIRTPDDVPPLEDCGGSGGVEYLEPWLPKRDVAMLWGLPESGKSSLASKVMARASRSRRCLLLDRENPLDTVKERFHRLHIETGANLIVWGRWNAPGPPNVCCERQAAMLNTWVKNCDPGPLIVVDSFLGFFTETGGDENSASQVRRYMDLWRDLTFVGDGATIILIAHAVRNGSRFRGSGDLLGGVDASCQVTNRTSTGLLDRIVLKAEKGRLGFHGTLVYRYAAGNFLMEGKTEESVVSLVRDNPGLSAAEFDKLTVSAGLSRAEARKFLDHCLEAGTIRDEGGGHNRSAYFVVAPPETQGRRGWKVSMAPR